MKTIENEVYTNAYMKAADMRCILHNIFIQNKYGFSTLLLNSIKKNSAIRLSENNTFLSDMSETNLNFPAEIYCDYNIEENGFGHYSKLTTIDTTMYVEFLSIFSQYIIGVIRYLKEYNDFHNVEYDDINKLYEFITTDVPTTKSSVSMLFDIRIYTNYLVISI